MVEEILDVLPNRLRRIAGQLSLLHELDPARCEKFCGVDDGRHLLDVGEFPSAFEIAFASVREDYHDGIIDRMVEWIARFPPEFVSASPDRCAAYTLALAFLVATGEAGFRALERAIALGAKSGHVWTYRCVGPEMVGVLRTSVLVDDRWSGSLLAMSLSSAISEETSTSAALAATERRGLALLPSYRFLPVIAAEMYVSVNTIKTPAKSIYAKLGVGTRGETVQRAAKTGLLTAPSPGGAGS